MLVFKGNGEQKARVAGVRNVWGQLEAGIWPDRVFRNALFADASGQEVVVAGTFVPTSWHKPPKVVFVFV